ncbi:DEAD/DEAH box helicase [Roseiconus lacunae]|uniref:DEAD/DEAH box helicase n=2 Tax=Roseiconus lacunae TaxID=2605694 RepID=UPI001F38617A|nr:DEAD/DEAH box helicase [Roseiconus lacunae]
MSNELELMDEAARTEIENVTVQSGDEQVTVNEDTVDQNTVNQDLAPTEEAPKSDEALAAAAQTVAPEPEVSEPEGEPVNEAEDVETAVEASADNAAASSPNASSETQPSESQPAVVSPRPAEENSEKNEGASEVIANAKTVTEPAPKKEESDEPREHRFRDFDLSSDVQLAIDVSGYATPTEVQRRIIPHILEGQDVLAQSQTGTGKTAAFALPLLSKIRRRAKLPQILVLAPTRELATQVAKSFETYGANIPKLRIVALYGGADYDPQLRALHRGVHVVVGTPGRVIDHIKRGALKLDALDAVVLDEADEMLNLGFIEDVEWILQQTPEQKQTALFSATMPGPIRRVADQYLNDPAVITVRKKTLTADTIEQRCVIIQERSKRELLCRLIEVEDTDGVLVFTKTKDSTVAVADHLTTLGLRAAALNGDLPQARRQKTVDQLKSGKLDILVATDVAARGLDVQRISHVFNYDLPHDSESYVHRIGRTGRAGRKGVAYIFLTPRQRNKLRLIEKATKQRIEVFDPPSKDQLTDVRIERFKSEIGKAMSSPDQALFKKILADYAEQSGTEMLDIAAALGVLSRGGQPLVAKDLAPSHEPRKPRDRDRDRDDDGGSRRRRSRFGERPESGMDRYWIGVGHSDGVRPGNIVGAIANEVGIPGSDIGPISINETFSTVDLPAGLPGDVIEYLQNTWVAGRQLRIRPFTEKPPRDGNGGGKGRYKKGFKGGKPGKKFGRSSSEMSDRGGSGRSGGKPGGKSGGRPFGKKFKSKKKFDRG